MLLSLLSLSGIVLLVNSVLYYKSLSLKLFLFHFNFEYRLVYVFCIADTRLVAIFREEYCHHSWVADAKTFTHDARIFCNVLFCVVFSCRQVCCWSISVYLISIQWYLDIKHIDMCLHCSFFLCLSFCVHDVDEAISHILLHSTGHSEGIVTEDDKAAEKFVSETDSAAVYVNVSTRFTDGGEFGLGCEMGISTQKLHARGPMGIEELTTYKYIIKGNGQVR